MINLLEMIEQLRQLTARLDRLEAHEPFTPVARVFNSAALSIPDNTPTALTFDSERYDNNAQHDTATNTSRLTCKQAGEYHIGACVQWPLNPNGYRQVGLRLNGSVLIVINMIAPISGATTVHLVSTDYQLAVNDYVEVRVLQNAGGALNVDFAANYSPEFWWHRIG